MIRFCKIIEARGQQFLIRACTDLGLIGRPARVVPPGSVHVLTVDTVHQTTTGHENMRMALDCGSPQNMQRMLDHINEQECWDIYALLVSVYAGQLSKEEAKQRTMALGVRLVRRLEAQFGPLAGAFDGYTSMGFFG